MISSLKVLDEYESCDFVSEVRIVKDILWGKFFSVDVQVFREQKLIEIFLFKAPASNIVQNHVNMLCGRAGEVLRLAPIIKKGVKLTFISLIPNTSPFFTQKGEIKHFEKNHVGIIDSMKPYISIDFSEITITFDIEGLTLCQNRQDVKNIFTNKKIITNIKAHFK